MDKNSNNKLGENFLSNKKGRQKAAINICEPEKIKFEPDYAWFTENQCIKMNILNDQIKSAKQKMVKKSGELIANERTV